MTDQTLPLSGGWVMITRPLPTQVKPPVLSIFYALPDRLFPKDWHSMRFPAWAYDEAPRNPSQTVMTLLWRSRNGGRLLPHERREIERLEGFELDQRVRIQTDDGDVWVEPYEWSLIPNIETYFEMVDGEQIKLHLQPGAKFSGVLADQLFYMQTRGLTRLDCFRLMFGEIKRPGICWFEIHDAYAKFFGIAA